MCLVQLRRFVNSQRDSEAVGKKMSAASWVEDHLGLVVFLGVLGAVLLGMVAFSTFRRKVLAVLATSWLWIAFWGGHSIVLILQLLFLCTVGWLLPTKTRKTVLGSCQFVALLALINCNPFWWVLRSGKRTRPPPGSIIMSNHLCYLDSWIVASQLLPMAPIFIAMVSTFSFSLWDNFACPRHNAGGPKPKPT